MRAFYVQYNKRYFDTVEAMLCKRLPVEVVKAIVTKAYPLNSRCLCDELFGCALCKYACCPKAYGTYCVCTMATECREHGSRCNGSHD